MAELIENAKIEEFNPVDGQYFLITKNKKLLGKTWDLESARIIADAFDRTVEPEPRALTVEELKNRSEPVYVLLESEGGYWCLCNAGLITPPSLQYFMASERPEWTFYDRVPKKRVTSATRRNYWGMKNHDYKQ